MIRQRAFWRGFVAQTVITLLFWTAYMLVTGIPFPGGWKYLAGEGSVMTVVLGTGLLGLVAAKWWGRREGAAAQAGVTGALICCFLVLMSLKLGR